MSGNKFYLVEIKSINAVVVEINPEDSDKDLEDLAIEYAEDTLTSDALNNADYRVIEIPDGELESEVRHADKKAIISRLDFDY